jgi:DNA primase large subunit
MTSAHVMYAGLVLCVLGVVISAIRRLRPQVQALRKTILESIETFETWDKQPRSEVVCSVDKRVQEAKQSATAAMAAMKQHMHSPLWFVRQKSLHENLARVEQSIAALRTATQRDLDNFRTLVKSPVGSRH